jgi:hypothetical protein
VGDHLRILLGAVVFLHFLGLACKSNSALCLNVEGFQNSVVSVDVALSSSVMPPLITSLRLAVEAADEFITSREQRRAYISPDALRTYKVPAGSWVILDTGKRHAAVLQLWPRATADIEGMSTFSLSGRSEMISLAVYVRSNRFPAGTDGNVDIHLFEPSSARIIKSIILSSSGSTEDLSGREKDWLISYLKEELGKSRGLGKD